MILPVDIVGNGPPNRDESSARGYGKKPSLGHNKVEYILKK